MCLLFFVCVSGIINMKHKQNIRHTKGGQGMNEEAKKARAEYMREWRRRNPDKTRKQRERYWARRAEKMAAEAAQQVQSAQPGEGRA